MKNALAFLAAGKGSVSNITEEDLEMVLAAAKVSGVAIVGFDELPMK